MSARAAWTHCEAWACDESDLVELLPEAEVVLGHPDPVTRLLVELAGGVDELGELGELGPVDPQVRAVAEDDPFGAQRQRLEQLREPDVPVADRDDHLEVQPVGALLGVLARLEPDHRRLGDLGVRRPSADLLDLDLSRRLERLQGLLEERDHHRSGQGLLRNGAVDGPVRAVQPVHLLVVEVERVEQRLLGVGAPDAAQAAGLVEGVDAVVLADPVAPRPGEVHLVDRLPRDGEGEPRLDEVGDADGLVGGDHRQVATEPGKVLRDEVGHVPPRHRHRVDPRRPASGSGPPPP